MMRKLMVVFYGLCSLVSSAGFGQEKAKVMTMEIKAEIDPG